MSEPAKRQLTAERDELLPRVGQRLEWMRREHRTFPDRGAIVRSMRGRFCLCARCESVRTRIDGNS